MKINIKTIINRLLTNPFFRLLATVFSHGATHFIFLIIVSILTSYLIWSNRKSDITPHNIGIHIGRLSTYAHKYRKENLEKVPMKDISMTINLNSESAKAYTNGKYDNSIKIEFQTYSLSRIIARDVQKNLALPAIYKEEKMIDSVVVSLICNPNITNCRAEANLAFIQKYDEPSFDSLGHRVKTIYLIDDKANNKFNYATNIEPDSAITVKFNPLSAKPLLYDVSFFSNDFGVKRDNPYYYYNISIPNTEFEGHLKISFNFSDIDDNISHNLKYIKNKNLQYGFIYPEPDAVGNGYIEYFSEETKQLLLKSKSIIIQAVDIDLLNELNRKNFLFSVLAGTGVAFILDIIVQLIRELNRLQIRRKNNSSGRTSAN